MSKSIRFGSAVSLLVLSSMIVGCATPQASAAREVKPSGEIGLATRAMVALGSNDLPNAINYAEQAVARTPDDAGFRALLGNAYFAAGRFWSAESAYRNALAIYSNQPQVVLKLALVEIALGKKNDALAVLDAGASVLDPADCGLALALAGRSDIAVEVLQGAARQPGADARVRQNLALAYAFAGDWKQARTVAAQDVPADQLDARLQQWMQLAKPGRPVDQVAALVGVTPASVDHGQPTRLALNKSDRTRQAQAAPAPVAAVPAPVVTAPQPQLAQATPVAAMPVAATAAEPEYYPEVAASAPAPAPQLAAVAPSPPPANPDRKPAVAKASSPAPVTMALVSAPVAPAQSIFAPLFDKKQPAAKPKARKAAAPRPAFRNSGPVVQLGAYRSPQYMNAAWNNLTTRYPALRAYLPMRAKFVSDKGTFYRLSIAGFGNQREAQARCQLLKSRGGNCFVRNFAGDAPVQYASR